MRNFLIIASVFSFIMCNSQSKQPEVGDMAPLFTLQNQDGQQFNMKDSVGKKIIVIFFYPKDESSVCTKEACAFRDSMSYIADAGAMVIGINQGSIESHKKFQQDYKLPYQLLSDPDEKVIAAFGVKGIMLTDRVTFVVDKTGHIVFKYNSLTQGAKHTSEVLKFLREIKK
ncbi:MAG: peroxiredoxin [Bacteroidia bacterium]